MNKPPFVHELKIHKEFADAVSIGEKTFEVRANDRGFQTGDFVRFQAVDEYGMPVSHRINSVEYQITYVLSGWAIGEGYVVFSIMKVKEE